MFCAVSYRSLLELLEREDKALSQEEETGENIIELRQRQEEIEAKPVPKWAGLSEEEYRKQIHDKYETEIEKEIVKRDKALTDLAEIRSQIKEYLLRNIL